MPHPNSAKLLEHAAWLREKGQQHPQTRRLCEQLADGMEIYARTSSGDLRTDVLLQEGVDTVAMLLQELGDPADPRLMSQMADDVRFSMFSYD